MRRLLASARPHLGALVVGTLLALLAGVAGLLQPLLAKQVIDALSAGRSLLRPVLVLGVLVVVAAVLGAANSYVLGRTAERVVLDVRTGLAERLVRLRVDELDHASPGDLISRTTVDSSLLRSAATTALVDLVDGGLRFVGAIVLMGVLDLRLLAVSMAVLVGVGVTVGVVVPRIRAAVKTAQEAVAAVAHTLYRALGAARTVKASGTEGSELARVSGAVATAYGAGVRGVRLNALLTAVTGLSIQVPFLAVLGVGGALVARGDLPVSTLVAFLLYLFYLIGPIGQLVGGTTTLQQGLAASERIGAVESMAVEDVPLTPVPPARRGDADAAALGVRFEHVSFTYAGRERVLDDVGFEAPGPGLTALVGPSGAGKTTLFSLLMRFYDLDAGRVLVGGRDVTGMELRELRRLIGYVEQDAPALQGTLLENLTYAAPGASAAEVDERARPHPARRARRPPARRARDARRHPRRPAVGRRAAAGRDRPGAAAAPRRAAARRGHLAAGRPQRAGPARRGRRGRAVDDGARRGAPAVDRHVGGPHRRARPWPGSGDGHAWGAAARRPALRRAGGDAAPGRGPGLSGDPAAPPSLLSPHRDHSALLITMRGHTSR